MHTAQTSNSSRTPLQEQETCEHVAGFGLTTEYRAARRPGEVSRRPEISLSPGGASRVLHAALPSGAQAAGPSGCLLSGHPCCLWTLRASLPFSSLRTHQELLYILLFYRPNFQTMSVHLVPLETDPYSKSHKKNITLGDILDKDIFDHKTGSAFTYAGTA